MAALLAGCREEKSRPAPASSSSPHPAAKAAGDAPARATQVVTGEVELRSGKKKVGYSIELPKGLRDVSELPIIKQYAKQAKSSRPPSS
ncbi:MAG TPA: hypothetical protein VHB21_26870 [Minicystis sp.]|nr:hypothetical protein [Minicystis sp.]